MTGYLLPECIVCLCPFEETFHYPRVLNCGHSLCEGCICSLISTQTPATAVPSGTIMGALPVTSSRTSGSGQSQSSDPPSISKLVLIRCPECSARTRLTGAGAQSLPKNIELMRLVEVLKGQPSLTNPTRPQRPQFSLSVNQDGIHHNADEPDSDTGKQPSPFGTCVPSTSTSPPPPLPRLAPKDCSTSETESAFAVGSIKQSEDDADIDLPNPNHSGPGSLSPDRLPVTRLSLESGSSSGQDATRDAGGCPPALSEPCTQLVSVYEGHLDQVSALAIAGNYLCSASFDKTICLWSIETGSLLHTLSSHTHRIMALLPLTNLRPTVTNTITSVTDTPTDPHPSTSHWLVSADYGCQVSVWDLGQVSGSGDVGPSEVATWQDHSDWRYFGVVALAGAGDGVVYTGGGDRVVKGWSTQDFSLLARMPGHSAPVSALVADSEVLYSGGWDGCLLLWWRADHSPLARLEGGGGIRALAAGGGGKVVCAREKGEIQVWEESTCRCCVVCHEKVASCVVEGGGWVYSGGWDSNIQVWGPRA